MAVQDDARENELRELFGLDIPKDHSRGGTDAVLALNGQEIQFELKSTSRGSVTTVRDFGMDHVQKWEDKHWLIGVYDSKGKELKYSLYGSPQAMSSWIQEKKEYISTDFNLANVIDRVLGLPEMYDVIGRKEIYSLEDAQALQKRQYRVTEYFEKMDKGAGYSPERMLTIFKERAQYLIKRGSTLNNPHIPASYFEGWEQIKKNHAERLRTLVKDTLNYK
jgi:hypothetical protein